MGLESQQTRPVLACKVQQQQVQSESSPVSRQSERPVSAQHRATQLVSAERCDRARRDYVMAAAKENRRNPAKTICLFDNDKTEKMNRQDGWGRCCGIDTRWASVAWMGCTTAVTQGSHWPEMGIFLACKTWARRTRAARTPTQFTGHPLSPLPATSTTGTAETAAFAFAGPAMRSTLKCTSSTCLALQSACVTIGMDTSEDKDGDGRGGGLLRGEPDEVCGLGMVYLGAHADRWMPRSADALDTHCPCLLGPGWTGPNATEPDLNLIIAIPSQRC